MRSSESDAIIECPGCSPCRAIEQGIEKGERAVLQKQLRLKFGPLPDSVLAKLDAATTPELERWAERVLTATTLDELLGD